MQIKCCYCGREVADKKFLYGSSSSCAECYLCDKLKEILEFSDEESFVKDMVYFAENNTLWFATSRGNSVSYKMHMIRLEHLKKHFPGSYDKLKKVMRKYCLRVLMSLDCLECLAFMEVSKDE